MKKLTGVFAIIAAFALLLAGSSCDRQEPEVLKDATLELSVKATTTESITFEITSQDAVKVYYSVTEAGEAENYVSVDAENGAPMSFTVDGLVPETEYTIKAYAENQEGKKSETVEEKVTTTTAASLKIEILEKGSKEVKFLLKPVNAVSMKYAVASGSSDVQTVELTEAVESGEETEITVDGLTENTSYTVVAVAVNASGEESERTFATFKTEQEPVVEILGVEAEYNQAKVSIKLTNAAQYGYAMVTKGSSAPEEGDFKIVEPETSETYFMLTGLEQLTEYTIYVYGIGGKGYVGETVSKDFTTAEYIKAPFEIVASDISSTGASVDVTFNSDDYSGFYYVSGSESKVDPEAWDWAAKIEAGYSRPNYQEYSSDQHFRIETWDKSYSFYPGTVYYAGGVPIRKDGTADIEAAVWQAIQLKPVVFGESTLKLNVNSVVISVGSWKFNVTAEGENADCYYFFNKSGDLTSNSKEELEELALTSSLAMQPIFTFGKDTVRQNLQVGSVNTFLFVARDKDGKLTEVLPYKVETKPLDFEGEATCTVVQGELESKSITFDCKLDEGTVRVNYSYDIKYSSSYDESYILKALKVNPRTYIESDQQVEFKNLYSGYEYVFGFCPVDKDGLPGKVQFFTVKVP